MKIIRNNMEIELTDQEMLNCKAEWEHKCNIEDVDMYITEWCENNGIPRERVTKDIEEQILEEYEYKLELHNENNDDWYYIMYDAAHEFLTFDEEE